MEPERNTVRSSNRNLIQKRPGPSGALSLLVHRNPARAGNHTAPADLIMEVQASANPSAGVAKYLDNSRSLLEMTARSRPSTSCRTRSVVSSTPRARWKILPFSRGRQRMTRGNSPSLSLRVGHVGNQRMDTLPQPAVNVREWAKVICCFIGGVGHPRPPYHHEVSEEPLALVRTR